jgi:uncharacterized membrane protein
MVRGVIFAKSGNKMQKSFLILVIVVLLVGIPTSGKAASIQSEQPVVNAVLFWSNGCPYCSQVLTTTLPLLQDKYKSQLNILLIELATSKDVDNLYALAASLGLTKEQVKVPFLLIDQIVLIGVDEINTRLNGLIEKYLSAGGSEYPKLPILGEMLPQGVAYNSSDLYLQLVSQTPAPTNTTGMVLAWGIMIVMVIALILALVMILRAFHGKPLHEFKSWLDIVIPILSIIGLGASIYLTYVEVTHTRALCGPVGDCNAVQSSPYAKLFGVLPIGLVGALGYIAILVTWLWRRLRTDSLSKVAGPVMYAMALFGTLFSVYLTYLELFVIHAVCIWCLLSAVTITALMLLNLPPMTQWLAISDDEE